MALKIMNFKDLVNRVLSPDYYIRKDQGKNPYIKGDGGLLIEVDESKKGIPQNSIYLSPEQAKKYNEITIQITELQEERKKIIE